MPALALVIIGGVAAVLFTALRASTPAPTPAPVPIPHLRFELDHDMPQPLVDDVLAALVHDHDPSALEALARSLSAKYPLAAGELAARATVLRVGAEAGAVRSSAPAAGGDVQADAAVVLQAAMGALVHEHDPVELAGFGESIRDRYPAAAVLLLERARELRETGHGSPAALPPPVPVSPASSGVAVPSATYVVQRGDTPATIAAKFVHNGGRWRELVAANSRKPTHRDGNFVSLRAGETISLPPAWTPAATSVSRETTDAHETRPQPAPLALPKGAHA